MGRRKRRNDSQGRAAGRVRGRVQQRSAGAARSAAEETLAASETPSTSARSKATRTAWRTVRGNIGLAGAASGLARAAPGLAGAASGFAGGSFASRLLSGDTSMSDEDFRKEVAAHFALLEERLQRLEELASGPVEPDAVEEDLPEPKDTAGPDSTV